MNWSEPLQSLQDFNIDSWVQSHFIGSLIRAALWLGLAWPALICLARVSDKKVSQRISPHAGLIVHKIITYGGTLLIIITILLDFNFKLSAILGTAGIASVAIGFAAQKSLSNLISGIFLIWEKPFQVGDLIQVSPSNTTGYVLSIDLLSVKIRTKDNLFLRIPNESLVESDFINISRFPVRRYGLKVGIAYDTDLDTFQQTILRVAAQSPLCLQEPAPSLAFDGFGDFSINYILYVWVKQENYAILGTQLAYAIIEAFRQAQIEIPSPTLLKK